MKQCVPGFLAVGEENGCCKILFLIFSVERKYALENRRRWREKAKTASEIIFPTSDSRMCDAAGVGDTGLGIIGNRFVPMKKK